MTLVEFLLARYDELEATARDASTEAARARDFDPGGWYAVDYNNAPSAQHGRCWTPERVLLDLESKRWIVGEVARRGPGWDPPMDWYDAADDNEPILRRLALPFDDHPDYRQEWRP